MAILRAAVEIHHFQLGFPTFSSQKNVLPKTEKCNTKRVKIALIAILGRHDIFRGRHDDRQPKYSMTDFIELSATRRQTMPMEIHIICLDASSIYGDICLLDDTYFPQYHARRSMPHDNSSPRLMTMAKIFERHDAKAAAALICGEGQGRPTLYAFTLSLRAGRLAGHGTHAASTSLVCTANAPTRRHGYGVLTPFAEFIRFSPISKSPMMQKAACSFQVFCRR